MGKAKNADDLPESIVIDVTDTQDSEIEALSAEKTGDQPDDITVAEDAPHDAAVIAALAMEKGADPMWIVAE